jgi:hypothetical protein
LEHQQQGELLSWVIHIQDRDIGGTVLIL